MKRKSRYKTICGLVSCVLVSLTMVYEAKADGTEVLGPPENITIAPGSEILVAGTGLNDARPGEPSLTSDISIEIPAGVTIKQVLLYWGGRTDFGAPYYGDEDTIEVDDNDVTGQFIGGDAPYGPPHSYTYRADITDNNWIAAGAVNVLSVGGLDFGYQDDGAAVVVIWDDGSSSDIQIKDGNDFAYNKAYIGGIPAEQFVTEPVDFTIESSADERIATIWLIVSDVSNVIENDVTKPRPNAVEVSFDVGNSSTLDNVLLSNKGDFLDVVELKVPVPAGATIITVEVQSIDDDTDTMPASLAWLFVAWKLQEDPGCTYTQGFWKNHEENWPLEELSIFTDEEAMKNLWTPPKKGNAYFILSHQYIAAELNVLNGASIPPEVSAAGDRALEILTTYKPAEEIPKNSPDRDEAIALAKVLDDYNNGLIGPGHCD